MQLEKEQLEKLVASGDMSVGGYQHKQRLVNILNKQIEQKENSLNEKQTELEQLKQQAETYSEKLKNVIFSQFLIIDSGNFILISK